MSKTTIKQPQTAIQTGGNSSNELYFGKYETMEDFDVDSGRTPRSTWDAPERFTLSRAEPQAPFTSTVMQ